MELCLAPRSKSLRRSFAVPLFWGNELGARLYNIQLHSVHHTPVQLVVAIMRRIDEELRFLHQLQSTISIDDIACAEKLLRLEHVLSEFSAGILVPEELGFVETACELGENLIFIL